MKMEGIFRLISSNLSKILPPLPPLEHDNNKNDVNEDGASAAAAATCADDDEAEATALSSTRGMSQSVTIDFSK